mmetsp:Transcript_32507/g.69226  ORF Transcript_32507/g.69226 Transcript_32507/m.69226 type:complete len:204 (-) Transcript_32507:223-834(-)
MVAVPMTGCPEADEAFVEQERDAAAGTHRPAKVALLAVALACVGVMGMASLAAAQSRRSVSPPSAAATAGATTARVVAMSAGLDGPLQADPEEAVSLVASPDMPSSCSKHPKCAGLGLIGDCCPSADGQVLTCCDFARQGPQLCSAHPSCREKGLGGYCCPNDALQMLDCCSASPVVLGAGARPAPARPYSPPYVEASEIGGL